MLSITITLDLVKLVAGVVLTYFVFFLYAKEFRSSVMEKGFRYIAISTLILTAGRTADLISAFYPTGEISTISFNILGTAFSLVLVYGFYLMYKVWHVDRRKSHLENPIISK